MTDKPKRRRPLVAENRYAAKQGGCEARQKAKAEAKAKVKRAAKPARKRRGGILGFFLRLCVGSLG